MATTPTKTRNGGPIIRAAILDPRCAAPPVIRRLYAGTEWCKPHYLDATLSEGKLDSFDIIVLVDSELPGESNSGSTSALLMQTASEWADQSAALVILTERPTAFECLVAPHVCLPPNSPIELVHGTMLGLLATRGLVAQIDSERKRMQGLSESLQRHFASIDSELRLASRLQKNFLPSNVKQIGPARFSTLYRPCSFVSGDIFDVMHLDEHHVAFYLADAVGHGVAAGLLTMYIKHAIQPKRATPNGDEILPPSVVLAMLNDQLASHELHDAQFITGWYGLLDLRTGRLEYAVAGHPPPLLVGHDGTTRELHGEGTLLGLSAGQTFSNESTQLNPGDRLMIYSDGLDHVLISHRPPLPGMPELHSGIPELLRKPTIELFAGLEWQLDNAPGSLNKGDDVSVLLLDMNRAGE